MTSFSDCRAVCCCVVGGQQSAGSPPQSLSTSTAQIPYAISDWRKIAITLKPLSRQPGQGFLSVTAGYIN